MYFLDLAKRRYPCRNYLDKKVEKEKLEFILEAAHMAPTGRDSERIKIIVVQEEDGLNKINEGASTYGASMAIIVCSDAARNGSGRNEEQLVGDIEASIVTDHMMLAATDVGLASTWLFSFNRDIIADEFDMPDERIPINILLLGYPTEPAEYQNHRRRSPSNEVVAFEAF